MLTKNGRQYSSFLQLCSWLHGAVSQTTQIFLGIILKSSPFKADKINLRNQANFLQDLVLF
jgi:hypothetical protein